MIQYELLLLNRKAYVSLLRADGTEAKPQTACDWTLETDTIKQLNRRAEEVLLENLKR